MAIRYRDWVPDFLREHRDRFQPFGWPEPDTRELVVLEGDWIEGFAGAGVTEDEARRASKRLLLNPPKYTRDHLASMLAVIQTMREERASTTTDPNLMGREQALAESKNCLDCGGAGLLTVYHPHPDPARRVAPSAPAHCVCAFGRWMRRTLMKDDELSAKRIVDLEDVQFGRAGWLLEPPGRDQAAPDRNALARLKATLARDGERTGKPRTMAEVLA